MMLSFACSETSRRVSHPSIFLRAALSLSLIAVFPMTSPTSGCSSPVAASSARLRTPYYGSTARP